MKSDEAREFLRKNKLNSPLVDIETELQLRRHRLDVGARDAKRRGASGGRSDSAKRDQVQRVRSDFMKNRTALLKAHSAGAGDEID